MNTRFDSCISLRFFLASLLFASTCGLKGYAQFTEISVFGGYVLGETFYTTEGYEVFIKDGGAWGASVSYYPNERVDVSLSYLRQESRMQLDPYYFNATAEDVPVSLNYIMIGVDKNHPISPTTFFFGGFDMGTAGLVSKDDDFTGVWKFAFDIHAGAKIYPSPKIGIRLQAGINFPVQYFGAAFTVGTGGSGAGVSASGSITQVNFLGGLIFRLNNNQ